MSTSPRIPAQVFGEVADDFDRVRLTYPVELVDEVLRYLGPGRRALEVGAGTGKATLAFVHRGLRVVAVEPDRAMAAVLARHVADSVPVQIAHVAFEEYAHDEPFDLLYSADAWHWTQPQTRWQMAAAALRPGGTLALFWNEGRIDNTHLRQSILDVYAAFAPTIVVHDDPVDDTQLFIRWPGNELIQREEFCDLASRVYRSRRTFSGADYLTLLSTRSQIRMLAPETRRSMLDALAGALGDTVPVAVEAVLYLARRVR